MSVTDDKLRIDPNAIETGQRPNDDSESPDLSRSAFVRWFFRRRLWLIIGAIFTASLVIVVIGRLSSLGDTAPLSTRNAAPSGGMAAAEILRANGVPVEQSDSFVQALEQLDGSSQGATVLLYDRNGFLDAEQVRALSRIAERLVVIEPRLSTLQGLQTGIRQAGVVTEGIELLDPECDAPDPSAAGSVTARDGYLYFAGDDGELCYPLPGSDTGMYAASSDGRIIVLGSSGILSNERLDEEGNAALVLRSLGSSQRVVWYLPGIADMRAAGNVPSLNDLAPAWLGFAMPWLAFVAVLAILWRGRRIGPLVFEPLPVLVKAAETAEGRARLYQDARAVDRAAANLRSGTLTRLARHFRLGPEATAEAVVDAAERHGAHSSSELRRALLGHQPRTEAELVQWAQQIDKLEKEATAS